MEKGQVKEKAAAFLEKIIALWGKVSYEVLIAGVFLFQFMTGRALDLVSWAAAWNAMDYSMGHGSRLLIGSIYRLFYGEYLDYSVAYKYVGIGIMITILVLGIVLGRLIRMAIAYAPSCRNAVWGTAAIYMVAPFSIAYVWNEHNLGRLDVYMLLIALLGIAAAVTIKNVYVKMVLYTLLGVVGLAIHQGFAFLYYPMIVMVMCFDVFKGNRVHVKYLAVAVISGLVNIAVAVYFQFFSSINFSSAKELADFLEQRTNLDIAEWALEIEYFQDFRYQFEKITCGFFQVDRPFLQMALILLILAPVLILYILVWRDVFYHLKHKTEGRIFCSPHFYTMLLNLCYVPMFLIHTDWGRHCAPLMAGPTFIFLFFLAKKDESMLYAYENMGKRIKAHPWYFVLTLIWTAGLDSFGARVFQPQIRTLLEVFQYGFHI